MKKSLWKLFPFLYMLFTFTGCSSVGNKTAHMGTLYGFTSLFALLLIIAYCSYIKKKDVWFLLLFSSVFIVNLGYFSLSISNTLEEALLANRISYLGSVFLPLSMLFIIMDTCKLRYPKWFTGIMIAISTLVFLLAASPGYSDLYYKSVSLLEVNGAAVLDKVYGSLHCVYLYYLIVYFSGMVGCIVYAFIRKKFSCILQAVILLSATFVNIAVWLAEQLVRIDFEFLSVSYVITELFLFLLTLLMQENLLVQTGSPGEKAEISSRPETAREAAPEMVEKAHYLITQLPTLTSTERLIYDYYLEGNGTKDILVLLNITENTLKYHNKNIYSKLGIASRKQLLETACFIKANPNLF